MHHCHRIIDRSHGINLRNLSAVLWLAVGLLIPGSPTLAAGDPVVLTTHNLAPYGYYQEDGRFDGIAVRVVTCALHAMNRPLEIRIVPWKRAQLEVRNGDAHGFFAASRNTGRDSYAKASSVIAEQTWTWYFRKDDTASARDAEFKTSRLVSSFLGANMQRWIERNGYRTTTFPPLNSERLLEMLLAGHMDAILANNQVMGHILRQRGLTGEVRSEVELNKPLSVYFSKTFLEDNPGFLETFNAAVPDCRSQAEAGDALN